MTPRRPDHAVSIDVLMALYHCDPLGVVWHGRYFEFFETARMTLMASRGLGPREFLAMGYRLFITDVRCRYMSPLRLGETAQVTAWYSQTTPLMRVAYDIRAAERPDVWCTRASTVLAITDDQGQLLPRTPDEIIDLLPQL